MQKTRKFVLAFLILLLFSFISNSIIIFSQQIGEDYYVQELSVSQDYYIVDVEWHPTEEFALLVGYEDSPGTPGVIIKTDGNTFQRINPVIDINRLTHVAWKPDGSYALLLGSSQVIKYDGEDNFDIIWEEGSGQFQMLWFEGVAWKPDGSYALMSGHDFHTEYAIKFDGTSLTILRNFSGEDIEFGSISWKPDGSYALLAGDARELWKFDGNNFVRLSEWSDWIDAVDWNPDGSEALIVGSTRVFSYNGLTFQELTFFPSAQLYCIGWNNDGSQALIGGGRGGSNWDYSFAVIYDRTTFEVLPGDSLGSAQNKKISWKSDDSIALLVTSGRKGIVNRFSKTLNVNLDVEFTGIYSSDILNISIYVNDENNHPVVGASLSISSSNGGSFGPILESGNGQYTTKYYPPSISSQTTTEISVVAHHQDLTLNRGNDTKTITISPSPILDVSASITPETLYSGEIAEIDIHVTSTLTTGTQAIAGVDLELESADGSFSEVEDLGQGNYRAYFTAPMVLGPSDLTITITASKSGYMSGETEKQITINPLEPGKGNLHILVVDSTGNPIAGAQVESTDQPNGQFPLSSTTNLNGIVTFNNILDGSYSLVISKLDYTQSGRTETVVPGETTSDTITLYSTKTETSLSCSVNSASLNIGEEIIVSGSLIPNLSEKSISISYTGPDGSSFTKTVTTSSDGGYSDSYTPDSSGAWSIQASWSGDDTHQACISEKKIVTIKDTGSSGSSPTTILSLPIEIIIILGIVAVVIVVSVSVVIFRRRKRSPT